MTRSITRTIFGSTLQTARHLGSVYTIPQYSTLNEWVAALGTNVVSAMNFYGTNGTTNVQPMLQANPTIAVFNQASYANNISDTQGMIAQYLAIGNQGHLNFQGADPTAPSWTGPKPHAARSSGLFGQIPFILRLYNPTNPNWDIPSTGTGITKLNYRHRTWLMIGGKLYVAYFLRLLTPNGNTLPVVSMEYNQNSNGLTVTTAFTPTANDLFTPLVPGIPGAPIATTGDSLSASAAIQVQISQNEINELINVATLLYNNPNQAIISEIAICQGLDKPAVFSPDGATSATAANAPVMAEACGTQVSTYVSSYYPIPYTSSGLTINMDLGAEEPLYGISA